MSSLLKSLHKYNFSKYPIESVRNRIGTDWYRNKYTVPSVPDGTQTNKRVDEKYYQTVYTELNNAIKEGTLDGDLYDKLNDKEKKIAYNLTKDITIDVTDSKEKKHGTITYNDYLVYSGKKPIGNYYGIKSGEFNPKTYLENNPVSVATQFAEKDPLKGIANENSYNVLRNYYNAEKGYQREEFNKKYDPNGIAAKYGYSAYDFDHDDLEEWAKSNNHSYDDETSYYGGKTGNKVLSVGMRATEEQKHDGAVLKLFADNNQARKLATTDMGAIASGVYGFGRGALFGVIPALYDWSKKNQYEYFGLNPEMYVSTSEKMAKTVAEHKIANIGGNIAGSVVTSIGVGGVISSGLSSIGWATTTAPIARQVVVEGVTGFIRGGVTKATSGGNTQDILLAALRDGLSSGAGGYYGARVTGTLNKLFTNTKYSGTVLNRLSKYATSTAGGLADAYADWSTDRKFVNIANEFGADLEQRTGADLVTDFAVALVLGTTQNMAKGISDEGKTKVEDVSDSYAKAYRDFAQNTDISNHANYIGSGEKLILAGEEYKSILDSVGANKEAVSDVKGFIDGINDGVLKKINNTSIIVPYKKNYNYDLDLAIGNIMDGKATFEDFKFFAPGNTANRQAFYEAVGIKLPKNLNLTNYSLMALNNKNRNINNLYLKHIQKPDVDAKTKDFYLKYDNTLKQSDSLTQNGEGGIIRSGGKINQNNFLKVMDYEKQAVEFYQEICGNNDDVVAISNNTVFSYSDILNIKKHIMSDSIKFKNGTTKQFDPDIDQALAWKRLMNGKNIKETDLLLLKHELEELTIMHEKNMVYEDAHELANKKYNWEDAISNFEDKDELY